jgi:transmembrane sensor
MGKSNFNTLVRLYLEGKISEEEKIKLEAWMDVRKTEDTGDLELSREDAEAIYRKIISEDTTEQEVRELASIKGRRTVLWWTYRVAASVLLVALVAYLGWQQGFLDDAVTKVASSGNTEKIILKDGSLVWLKGTSNLVYYNKYDEGIRYSELKGEALFEVAEDEKHPFVINCGNVTLKVVGTSFSVRAVNDSVELRVLTGKVNFSTSRNKAGVDVVPNEKIVYGGGDNIVKVPMDTQTASAVTKDTEYMMSFKGATLSEVLARLEKKFDVTFALENNAAATCRITIDITDYSLDKSLEILSDVLYITWKRNGKTIRVSGKGC